MRIRVQPLTRGRDGEQVGWAFIIEKENGDTYVFEAIDAEGKVDFQELERFVAYLQGIFDGVRLLA